MNKLIPLFKKKNVSYLELEKIIENDALINDIIDNGDIKEDYQNSYINQLGYQVHSYVVTLDDTNYFINEILENKKYLSFEVSKIINDNYEIE